MISSENIIPLAAMFQAGYLINDIAYRGSADQSAFETCIKSVLILESETVLDVYGGDIQNLRVGFDLLASMFNKENKQRDKLDSVLVCVSNTRSLAVVERRPGSSVGRAGD